jgi:hypothetical protein
MKLDNPFPQSVRNLFLYVYWCFKCGRSNRGLELHHIFGRVSASALNACPLCKFCHGEIVHTVEEEQELLKITINFLVREGYKLKPVDDSFLDCVQDRLRGFDI